jgi:hypothetical protein
MVMQTQMRVMLRTLNRFFVHEKTAATAADSFVIDVAFLKLGYLVGCKTIKVRLYGIHR